MKCILILVCFAVVMTMTVSGCGVREVISNFSGDGESGEINEVEGVQIDIKNDILSSNWDNPDLSKLHTYEQLVTALYEIAGMSDGRVTVGPLINIDGSGLLPVDLDLIRAIMATVGPVDENLIPKFGSSTQGRPIMAAKIGNPLGRKILVMLQIHGNEVTSTEAGIQYLKAIATSEDEYADLLNETEVLFIVRANPDGGEPDVENCLMPTDYVYYSHPFDDRSDCALQRFTVDSKAGEEQTMIDGDLHGVPFVGVDSNRYIFGGLNGPIYAPESQAVVYAMIAYKPVAFLDLHSQNIKIRCDDSTEEKKMQCEAGTAGEIVDGAVQAGAVILTSYDEDVQRRSESLGAHVLYAMNETGGLFTRFSQTSSSLPANASTSLDAAMALGIPCLWIEVKGNSELIAYPKIEGGETSFGAMIGRPFTPGDYDELVSYHKLGLDAFIQGVVNGVDQAEGVSNYSTNQEWAPANYDLFIISKQMEQFLLQAGYYAEPFTDQDLNRITILLIE